MVSLAVILVGIAVCAAIASKHDAQVVFDDAKRLFEAGDYERTSEKLEVLAKIFPKWPDNYINWASALIKTQKIQKALDVLLRGVTELPKDPSISKAYCKLLSHIYQDRFSNPTISFQAESIHHCVRAVELLPNDPEPALYLATLLASDSLRVISIYKEWLTKFEAVLGHTDAQVIDVKCSLARTIVHAGDHELAYTFASEAVYSKRSPHTLNTLAFVRTIGWPHDILAWDAKFEALQTYVQSHIQLQAICTTHKSWRLVLNYSIEAATNPSAVTVSLLNAKSAMKTYGEDSPPVFVTTSLPKYPHLFHERFIFLVRIQRNAYISGIGGIVHGDCVIYTGSHHVNAAISMFPTYETDIQMIPEIGVSIVQFQQTRNYYHWMLESVPKLIMLGKLIHSRRLSIDQNFRILVPQLGVASYVDEILQGLPEFQWMHPHYVEYKHETKVRYHFPQGLYLLDWIHPENDQHGTLTKSLWSSYWPPREAHWALRDFFYDILDRRGRFPKTFSNDKEIIYISRRGQSRAFSNEEELEEALLNSFPQNRVYIHHGKGSLLDQIATFTQAKVVVGTHGAGLLNYVFAREKAALVMIPMRPHVEFCFGHMVSAMGGRQYILSDIQPGGGFYSGGVREIAASEIELYIDTVKLALEDFNNSFLGQHEEL